MSTAIEINKYDVRIPGHIAYDLKVKTGEKKLSTQKQTPHHHLECEIINAVPLDVDGQQVDINGIIIYKDVYLTDKSIRFINEFRRACGMEEIDVNDIHRDSSQLYVGKVFKCSINSSLEPRVDKVTKVALMDPYTRKAVTDIKREIGTIFCPPR